MNNFKGTKGKWVLSNTEIINGENIYIKTNKLISVIDKNKETICICGRKEPIQLANAKLISSAPEMLEMLEGIKGSLLIAEDMKAYRKVEKLIKEATEI